MASLDVRHQANYSHLKDGLTSGISQDIGYVSLSMAQPSLLIAHRAASSASTCKSVFSPTFSFQPRDVNPHQYQNALLPASIVPIHVKPLQQRPPQLQQLPQPQKQVSVRKAAL